MRAGRRWRRDAGAERSCDVVEGAPDVEAPLSDRQGGESDRDQEVPLVPEARNFFVFDLSGIQDEIDSASLRLYNPGYYSTQPSETLGLWDFTSSVAALRDGSGGVGAYADLGSGTSYGTHVFTAADNNQLVTLPLNAAALADLQQADELFSIGGSLLTYDGLGEALFAFGGPAAPDHTRQLVLELVPEPNSSLLLASGLAGVACWRRRVTRDANRGRG